MIIIKTKEEFNELIKKDRILVDFYADWCTTCNRMLPVLDEIDKEENIEIVKVNTDIFMSIAKEYKVMTIPTLILFSKGKKILDIQGFMTKEELLNKLNN